MDLYTPVVDTLNKLAIPFQIVAHPPALTIEQADSFIEGIDGVRTKTLFLCNRKKTAFYLLIMDSAKRLDMDAFKETVGESRISMTSSNSLFEKMKLSAGVVSPFGLLNTPEKDIAVYIDQAIMSEERMSFHPNTNEKTLFLASTDLLKFLTHIGCPANIIEL
ncbi:prolyl-tRNA synthetase associated domain-containing protein [Wielerella bovis]|uniref:prolyl-tRNA synthetase associated domain-containing protein n=1 Tax=Wielerella bovis TaxID=2917790 RepID=UPI00201889CA|nr:prolyl-tRNA synthetase associated domain-containing protein [Wielerella bovis]ULJ59955.1 prolyl-tRNA synthetase associated domain-containing protein [Wielerella bovis]